MFDPTSVRFRGPLADHGNRFWSALLDVGYSPLTAVNHLRLAADFSRWLYDHRLGLTGLSDEMIDVFLKNRKRRGYTTYCTRHGVQPLLAYLQGTGIGIHRKPVVTTALDELLVDYAEHLARDRRLCGVTVAAYLKAAREVAIACFGSRDPQWGQLSAEMVTDFVMRETRRRSSTFSTTRFRSCDRSFASCTCRATAQSAWLAACLPSPAGGWRRSFPRSIPSRSIGCSAFSMTAR